jgi:hypothetical protein
MRRIFVAPMLSVYFDTNVYDLIDKGRIPSADLEALRLAFNDGRLVGHLGIPVIEELFGQWEKDRVAVVRKLVLVRDLIGFDRILKPANTLLEEAIRAYAAGIPSPSPFLAEVQHVRAVASFRRIIAGDAGLDAMISKIVADVPPDKRRRFLFDKSERFLETGTLPEPLPAWLTEADLHFYT